MTTFTTLNGPSKRSQQGGDVESVRVVCISFGCIKGPRMPVKSENFEEPLWCMGGDTPYILVMFFAKYYSTMSI